MVIIPCSLLKKEHKHNSSVLISCFHLSECCSLWYVNRASRKNIDDRSSALPTTPATCEMNLVMINQCAYTPSLNCACIRLLVYYDARFHCMHCKQSSVILTTVCSSQFQECKMVIPVI